VNSIDDAVVIRRAGPADAAALAPMLAAEAALQERLGGYPLAPGFDWSAWAGAQLRTPGQRIYVAEQDGAILGYVQGRLRAPPAAGARVRGVRARVRLGLVLRRALQRLVRRRRGLGSPADFAGYAVIESLYVLESQRRRGLARRLVETLRTDLGALGAQRLEISVMVANAAAMAFWQRQGFAPHRAHMQACIDADADPGG
jgi:ribosomal protein S18 acetylase RimI-like enzyme